MDFNPRAPCGARPPSPDSVRSWQLFQSTRPVWGATIKGASLPASNDGFQSTRPVWGATLVHRDGAGQYHNFNPRAPCGARRQGSRQRWIACLFQSTRPVWGATTSSRSESSCSRISIHAPRVGRDGMTQYQPEYTYQFQSTRPVWGATSKGCRDTAGHRRFQSTRPVWGATARDGCGNEHGHISIHAPRVGRDDGRGICACEPAISIHAPRVGRDSIRP